MLTALFTLAHLFFQYSQFIDEQTLSQRDELLISLISKLHSWDLNLVHGDHAMVFLCISINSSQCFCSFSISYCLEKQGLDGRSSKVANKAKLLKPQKLKAPQSFQRISGARCSFLEHLCQTFSREGTVVLLSPE